jgi:hypothetical protein
MAPHPRLLRTRVMPYPRPLRLRYIALRALPYITLRACAT